MPKFTKEQEENIKSKIRSLLVRAPMMSKYKMGKALKIDPNTALKYKKRVLKENTKLIDKQLVNVEIGRLEQEYNELCFECWDLINSTKMVDKFNRKGEVVGQIDLVSARDKVGALKALIEAKKTLFGIKFDAGIFKKKLGELKFGLFDYTKQDEDRTNNGDKKAADNGKKDQSGPGRNERKQDIQH